MDIFEYFDYKIYLNERLDRPQDGGGRGSRSRLSHACDCQTSYTAQVLRGSAHFSLEQAEAINEYLGHSENQARFLILLVQLARAGSPALRKRFEREIEEMRLERLNLQKRLGVKSRLNSEDQTTYYSAWYFAAIHVLVSIPRFQSPKAIANELSLSAKHVQEALQFLVRTQMIEEAPGGYRLGTTRIHLGADSPAISKHHTNWRLQAIRSLEQGRSEDMHYSSVVTISVKDALRIREMLVKAIENAKGVIKDSPEEELRALCLDFFKV